MSIESTSAHPVVGKSAHSGAGNKGVASAGAGDALGFLAMLSAADDAMALSAESSGLPHGSDGLAAEMLPGEDKELLALDADANVLAGWVLGVPAPVAQDALPRVNAAHGASSAGGADSGLLNSPTAGGRKAAKTPGTWELQQTKGTPSPALPQGQGPEPASRQLPDVRAALAPEVTLPAGLESREVAPVAVLTALGERHHLEPVAFRAPLAEGTYFQPQAASAPMGMDGVVAAQSAAPLEAYIAEQVTYWIGQDVQSAELTLDGVGASPVEVSISMQGNEAQVTFRTDEMHARNAIENASEQLKDSLQRQGVVLTGMSVGTSGGGDASGQGRRPRQEGRQAVVTALVPAQTEGRIHQAIPQGRAVDLFV